MSNDGSEFVIELAKPDELEEVWNLYETEWMKCYPNEEFGVMPAELERYMENNRAEIKDGYIKAINGEDKQRCVLVARLDGAIVGVVAPKVQGDKHFVMGLYVRAPARHNGIGRALLERALEWLGPHDAYLYVAPYLESAINLYRRYGFEVIPGAGYTYFEKMGNPVPHLSMRRPYKSST
jgi:GNAT superfamily N-acetyltransferase